MIVTDLPSHGRSSGLHSFVSSTDYLVDALHAVIKQVQAEDTQNKVKGPRKVFLMGVSNLLYFSKIC